MPRPVTVTVTGVGTSLPVLVDRYVDTTALGIGCVVTGTVSYSVEHSYEAPPVNWFPDPVIVAQSANKDNPSAPGTCQYVRCNVASGTGTVTMTVVQTGAG